ncbi:MAG TPA: PDZ domain-containing protein, partial [Verrucomicrobiales bacterium]|nr:PDZ domain-containing protein [Verrucomicrobiales bacterium]
MNVRRLSLVVSFMMTLSSPGQGGKDAKTPAGNSGGDAYAQMDVLTRAMEIIRQNYVDEDKVSYERLVTAALRGMLQELDPHCQYIAPELNNHLQQPGDGSAEGAGFTLAPRGGGLTVVTVREDGPAARAGLMPGDQVLKIEDAHAAVLDFL